jgi:hypothetical protein
MRLGDTNFFNLFARLAAASNKNRDCDSWRVADVTWTRARHVYWGPCYSFQIETHELVRPGRGGWQLLVAHEMWWPEDRKKTFRNARWSHLAEGPRTKVLEWFKERERELD